MINVEIIVSYKTCNAIGFNVCGHSGYDTKGKDIVCSAVSSTSQMVVIGLQEINADFNFKSDDGILYVLLNDHNEKINIIEAFRIFIEKLENQYKDYIKVSYYVME